MIWASRWSVALRTFYRQILSVLYTSFSFWKLPPPACPGTTGIYAYKRTRLQNLSWGCFNLPFAFLCVLVRFLPWEINVDTFEIDSNYTYFRLVWDKLPIYERIFVLLVRETFKDDAVKAHTADESDAGGHWLQGHEMSGPSWTWQRWHFQSTVQASSHDLGAIAKGPTKVQRTHFDVNGVCWEWGSWSTVAGGNMWEPIGSRGKDEDDWWFQPVESTIAARLSTKSICT